MSDHPFDLVLHSALAAINEGGIVYQKFTCANCGQRLTMDVPNKFWTSGTCDQCGHTTDIQAQGHNFMLVKTAR